MKRPLSPQYAWLLHIDVPAIIREALRLHGTREMAGKANNPDIMAWAREVGLESVYKADEIPWCGLFAAIVVHRAKWRYPSGPLWARNWAKFGKPSPQPSLGDVLVFTRGETSGHVGFYVAEDATHFHVLGGNQGDAVSIVRIEKTRLIQARRPEWRIAQPDSVKPYRISSTGVLSSNEA